MCSRDADGKAGCGEDCFERTLVERDGMLKKLWKVSGKHPDACCVETDAGFNEN
jgi:hypothetical protein